MDPPPPSPLGDLPDPLPLQPLPGPPRATVTVPGGRSITNRALVAAALAEGTSTIEGAGLSDDSAAMIDCLEALGARLTVRPRGEVADVEVEGMAGGPRGPATVHARLSGTTSRFVTPVAALATEPVVVDAAAPMRSRPMQDLLVALRELGVEVRELGAPGHLPVEVVGPLRGSEVTVPGATSSQYISGLLLAAPATRAGLEVRRSGTRLVSGPYIAMTIAVMAAFGVEVVTTPHGWVVPAGPYRPGRFVVPADAASAAYWWTAATLTGGRIRVPGVPDPALQPDAAFADVLAAMGAEVIRLADGSVEVGGPAPGADGRVHLRGGRFDLTDLSDMAPTLAVAAAFADEPVEVEGIGFVRGKESDRITASVTELRRCGVRAEERPDGFVVAPGGPGPHGAVVRTYDDHRMAMSFALLGLVVDGIEIADPHCVAKTYPGYWSALGRLARP